MVLLKNTVLNRLNYHVKKRLAFTNQTVAVFFAVAGDADS
jgi:hypothetical protein